MGLISSLRRREHRSDKVNPLHPRDPVLASWFGGTGTAAGANVNADTALRLSTVWACVNILAHTMAALPLFIYRRTPSGRERDLDHPLYDVLHAAPNQVQTSFEWRETSMAHAVLRGSAYSVIADRNDGGVAALEPLNPDRVTPFRAANNTIAFEYRPEVGPRQILLDAEVLRLPGLSVDPFRPLSPISLHRETFGLSMASQEYLARFYRNSSVPKGAIKTPELLGDEAATALRESWERRHQGAENAHRLAIFDGGMEFEPIGMSNDDAQYLELQQFGVEEIARIFGVPLVLLQSIQKTTSWGSGVEQIMIAFVRFSLGQWARRWEHRLNRSLLTAEGRRRHVIGFEFKELLRGDSKARAEFYRVMFGIGAMSPNDIRRSDDMPEREGGDEYFVPLNMAPGQVAAEILQRATLHLHNSDAPSAGARDEETGIDEGS
ncbi:MAG: phage portal protein [Alphaproteobacteria bacterium]|jgi:HK97 family phage portal protein|nr:phage portal protein [Alphaproteobacteria bacterium]